MWNHSIFRLATNSAEKHKKKAQQSKQPSSASWHGSKVNSFVTLCPAMQIFRASITMSNTPDHQGSGEQRDFQAHSVFQSVESGPQPPRTARSSLIWKTQACSCWAWCPGVLPTSMRWNTSASPGLFPPPPEACHPASVTVETTPDLAPRSCWNSLCAPVSPLPSVLGANLTLEAGVLWPLLLQYSRGWKD